MKLKNHVLASKAEYCTADYGTREPSYSTHHGMDFINDAGHACDVIAVADGEVVYVQDGVPGYDDEVYTAGNFVRIKHESGVYSRYLHLVNGSVKVKVGQKVKAGAVLGTEGNTGYSMGTHLHFDINDGNGYVDPLPYLLGEKSFGKTQPKENTTKISVGDKVKVKAGAVFSDGTKPFDEVYSTVYDVQSISRDGKEARIGIGEQWTGWMYISDLYPAEQAEQTAEVKTVKTGGKVTVNAGAVFSDGTEPYPFVFKTTFDVITMSKDGKEALIGIGTDVTGWMYTSTLTAV